MHDQYTPAAAPQSIKDRTSQLRSALTDTSVGRELFAELMPADIARVGKGTVLDFSDWSQWDQWGQWQ
jgi:hypothetical protein